MKYLILLEGSSEKAFIELLMEKGLLKISLDEMLDLKPHTKRQIDNYLLTLIRQLDPNEIVTLIRIGDKMTDRIKIPNDVKHHFVKEAKYCTKPEFEMLVIIASGLFKEFQKHKSELSPKDFAKANVVANGKRYQNTQKWIKDFFANVDLLDVLKTYKKLVRHQKNEYYLCDLLID